MSDTLYRYYEEELTAFRQRGREFSESFPAAAGQLHLDRSQNADPHVERLIQSFAFLNARIRKKLDDDYPELTDALLSIVYPHYLAPVPSTATIQFLPESANLQANGRVIERHSSLYSKPVDGVPCRFRTCYPVALWPVEILEANVYTAPFPENMTLPDHARAAIKLTLKTTGANSFNGLSLEQLRFHLDGEPQFVAKMYELLFNQAVQVEFRSHSDDQNAFRLNARSCIGEVGFERDQSLLPYPANSFVGYQLLTELFSFPEKFAYFDLSGFDRVAAQNMGDQIDVTFFVKQLPNRIESEIHSSSFKLGCTPVVNLFERICEPIQLNHKKVKYRVTPDVHHHQGFEIYSIDSVKSADPHNERIYHPFYSFQKPVHGQGSEAFWYASREESTAPGDEGTNVNLHLVDPNFNPHVPAEAALTTVALCTNRDLPMRLQFGREKLHFELESAFPLKSIVCLHHPTVPLRARSGLSAQWQLVSHLTLNHLSLTNSDDALDSLKQMLRLYDFADRNADSRRSAVNRQMVEGMKNISSRRVTRRLGTSSNSAFCRGMQIQMKLDEEKYIDVGAFLFASVMRHFFTKYASINSFVELKVLTERLDEPLRHWPPLVGEEQVI